MSAGENDWAAVCFFYAAYHVVRAALVSDPIFDDPGSLSKIRVGLAPQDRHTERHKGRKNTANGREWGVNELVLILYRPFAGAYDRLHQASIDVRYGRGLRAPSTTEIRQCLDKIEGASNVGQLTSYLYQQ